MGEGQAGGVIVRHSDRLVRFAAAVNRGATYKDAALEAGYAETTALHSTMPLVERARAAGLLVKPGVVQDAVAIIEEGLPDLAREIVRVGRGDAPRHDAQLDWIREAFDRTRGRPKAGVDVTSGGKTIEGWVLKEVTVNRPAGENAASVAPE